MRLVPFMFGVVCIRARVMPCTRMARCPVRYVIKSIKWDPNNVTLPPPVSTNH